MVLTLLPLFTHGRGAFKVTHSDVVCDKPLASLQSGILLAGKGTGNVTITKNLSATAKAKGRR